MKKTMYFISGVSGVGKTSVMSHLKTLIGSNFEIHDFDERGVPSGADHAWRIEETKYWIDLGNKKSKEEIALIVCGFANPDEIDDMQKDDSIKVETILLDGDDEVIEQRLRDRNKDKKAEEDLERVTGSAEVFIQNNRKFTPVLREICKKHNCSVVDTTQITPENVAEEIAELIK